MSESPTNHNSQEENEFVFRRAALFVREFWLRLTLISAAMLIPCVWHRRVVAADLGSHLYNAWLVQLIRHGQAPGLSLASRWNNVLFDYLLEFLSRFFPLITTETIAVALCVMVFFWGMFALVAAANGRAPWLWTPMLAMFAYGYTFHMGFFNYYLALGLSFWGLAIVWRARPVELLSLLLIGPLVYLAHPLGFVWLVGGGAFVYLARRNSRWMQLALVFVAIGALAAVRWYLWHHNVVEVQTRPFFYFWGGDQLLLFGSSYGYIAAASLIVALIAILWDSFTSRSKRWERYAIPLELYLILLAAASLLPEGVRFADFTPALALLTERLTSVTAVLLCCLLGALQPRKWHLVASGAIAFMFFGFVFQDTARINRMEAQLENLLRTIPPNQRVLGTIRPFSGSRILIQHMLDRACIGRCFSYGNYEPAARLFRVRATDDNPYVMPDFDSTAEMEDGTYEVQENDLPAYQVSRCAKEDDRLCIRKLAAGEWNDYPGKHPNP